MYQAYWRFCGKQKLNLEILPDDISFELADAHFSLKIFERVNCQVVFFNYLRVLYEC